MNGLYPNIVPELSSVMIGEQFYNVFWLDAYHWGHAIQLDDDKYSIFRRDRGAYFIGTLEECIEQVTIGVINV